MGSFPKTYNDPKSAISSPLERAGGGGRGAGGRGGGDEETAVISD